MNKKLCKMLALAMFFSAMPTYSLSAQEMTAKVFEDGIQLDTTTASALDLVLPSQLNKENKVTNGGFENGGEGWNIEGTIWGIVDSEDNVKSGKKALNYGNEVFTVSQTIVGLEDGMYQLDLWVHGSYGKEIEIFAEVLDGGRTSQNVMTQGWVQWQNSTLKNIEVKNGECTIGITSLGGSDWGWIDDVNFSLQPVEEVDKTTLQNLIEEAVSYQKDSYTAYTWNKFQDSLDNACKEIEKLNVTEKELAKAYESLSEAIEGLMRRQVIDYEEIHVNPIEKLGGRTDFINGVDVSSLHIVTQKGGEFYDVDGSMPYPDDSIKNALAIMQNHGVNWIRLRIWNDPKGASQNSEYQDKGPGGLNDLDVTKEIAKKAKELGLKFLLDFHYSDTWVHPGQQIIPEAWKGMSLEEASKALYDYTDLVLKELDEVGALPDMVQVGNENNDGMVHPLGKINATETDTQKAEGYLSLLRAGIKAVRENEKDASPIKIMIHLAEGGNSRLFNSRFELLEKAGIDYDVIGASYYPYWHGEFEDLQNNLDHMAQMYNKEVVIAETSYAYTTEADNTIYPNGTTMGNIFGEGQEKDGGFKATIQGQATALRDVIEVVAQIPNNKGIGTFYWEPAWIVTPDVGAGWGVGTTEASWANQALFDYRGQAMPSIDVYDLITTGTYKKPQIVSIEEETIAIQLSQGQEILLPSTVDALYSDDAIRGVAVEWEAFDETLAEKVGEFTVRGHLLDSGKEVVAHITITPRNYLQNGGFEDGKIGWQVEGNATGIQKDSGNAKDGSWAFNYNNNPFKAYQSMTDLPKGIYTFTAYVQGAYEKTIDFFVEDSKGKRETITITKNGWREWQEAKIENIEIKDGMYQVGFLSEGGSDWGWADDISFILVEAKEEEGPVVKPDPEIPSSSGGVSSADKKEEIKKALKKLQLPEVGTEIIKRLQDIDEHPANKAIEKMIKLGIMVGKSENAFKPDDTLKRAELAVILNKILPQTVNDDTRFLDIKGDEWYAESVHAMAEIGLLVGYEDTTFRPYNDISKMECITIISRLMAYYDGYQKVESVDQILSLYTEKNQIPTWCREAVAWGIQNEFIQVDEANQLGLERKLTRAEVAIMLDKILEIK